MQLISITFLVLKVERFNSFNDEHFQNIDFINLSNFGNKKLTNMSCLFSLCSSLEEIDFSNFNTTNVTDMSYMFFECSSIKELDLSSFDTTNEKLYRIYLMDVNL